MIIDYQELCKQPTEVLPRIEAFTGIQSIDADVLRNRINNYNRIREKPPELITEELAIVERYQTGIYS